MFASISLDSELIRWFIIDPCIHICYLNHLHHSLTALENNTKARFRGVVLLPPPAVYQNQPPAKPSGRAHSSVWSSDDRVHRIKRRVEHGRQCRRGHMLGRFAHSKNGTFFTMNFLTLLTTLQGCRHVPSCLVILKWGGYITFLSSSRSDNPQWYPTKWESMQDPLLSFIFNLSTDEQTQPLWIVPATNPGPPSRASTRWRPRRHHHHSITRRRATTTTSCFKWHSAMLWQRPYPSAHAYSMQDKGLSSTSRFDWAVRGVFVPIGIPPPSLDHSSSFHIARCKYYLSIMNIKYIYNT